MYLTIFDSEVSYMDSAGFLSLSENLETTSNLISLKTKQYYSFQGFLIQVKEYYVTVKNYQIESIDAISLYEVSYRKDCNQITLLRKLDILNVTH